MRLVCPNCDAEYEVVDGVVPADGRDVQCSNCTTTWFQAGAGNEQEQDDTPDEISTNAEQSGSEDDSDAAALADAAAAVATPQPRKPDMEQADLDIIHEEVERETAARAAERGSVETQADLGLDDTETETRATAARDRMARRRGLDPRTETVDDDDGEGLSPAPKRDEGSAKKELFPDIEEINSTLSPETAEAQAEAERLAAEGGETPVEIRRSSFRLGFGLMLLVAVALLLVYNYSPQISARIPALSGVLAGYVAIVDGLRVTLDSAAQGLVEQIGTTLNSPPEG